MYTTLKSLIRRGSALGAAVAVAAVTVTPAMPVFADSLNPLTDRSLTLSSSSPGWSYTDGSGNITYATPNSGANGKQTGNTFGFKVSSNATIKGMDFQYCTTSAGNCLAPGDNGWTGSAPSATRNADSTSTSDLNVTTATPTEVSAFGSYVSSSTGDVTAIPNADNSAGNFVVYYNNAGTWTQSSGWTMTATNKESDTVGNAAGTGANNYITLKNTTGQALTSGQQVKVVFFGTNTNYITNPGSGAFFVKINTYNDNTTLDGTTMVDGGVTVANVMNQSIQIQTKVLETMQFSVGTVDPNTLSSTDTDGGTAGVQSPLNSAIAGGQATHGTCDPILNGMTPAAPVNVLELGNQAGENSLAVDHTYSTHSYWRLSSNSSAGATVYYSGVTLSNTVGDKIDAIGATAAAPLKGKEQFGLALTTNADAGLTTSYVSENNGGTGLFENGADNGLLLDATTGTDNTGNTSYHAPQLKPLDPKAAYADGAGVVNSEYGTIDTSFAFDDTSNSIPVALASENSDVVDCVTGRMRYVANIAATTPAGIYTTKINYIAAPMY